MNKPCGLRLNLYIYIYILNPSLLLDNLVLVSSKRSSVSLTVAFEQYPSLLTLCLSRKTPLQSTGPFMSPKTAQGLLPIQLCTVQVHFSDKRGGVGSNCDLLN